MINYIELGGLYLPERRFKLSSGLEAIEVYPKIAWRVDFNPVLELIPAWDNQIIELASKAPEKIIRGGSVNTSGESGDFETRYHPTNGITIHKNLPWAIEYYRTHYRNAIAELMEDDTIYAGKHLGRCVNANLTKEGPYERHRDEDAGTVLQGVTTLLPNEGGVTRVWTTMDRAQLLAKWKPVRGEALIFNGRYPHEVTAFKPSAPGRIRVTWPCDFYSSKYPEPEPDPEHDKAIGINGNGSHTP